MGLWGSSKLPDGTTPDTHTACGGRGCADCNWCGCFGANGQLLSEGG